MQKVLVSACLLGEPVRYNGADKRCDDEILRRWIRDGRVVAVCPEISGGLPVPRPPAEIEGGAGGTKVLSGVARVLDPAGRDVTAHFLNGAEAALAAARANGIRVAVLKEGSPSCGSAFVYDGTFTGTRVADDGVTAALLRQAEVRVFSELQLVEADRALLEDSETANRELLERIYAGLADGHSRLFIESLSEEVSWKVTGRTKWSRTYRGKSAVMDELLRPLRAKLADRYRAVAERIVADGDFVVVQARGNNVTIGGDRYDNEYCFVYRLDDGKIVEVVEYVDTELVTSALGRIGGAP